jgi:hypothetical protein
MRFCASRKTTSSRWNSQAPSTLAIRGDSGESLIEVLQQIVRSQFDLALRAPCVLVADL